jgi:hypothetical protein
MYHNFPSFGVLFYIHLNVTAQVNEVQCCGLRASKGRHKILYGILVTGDCNVYMIMNNKLCRHISKKYGG